MTESILKNVPIQAIQDHIRSLVMHRYPSELCNLFEKYHPEAKRHASTTSDEVSSFTLFYHYLLHGFRSTKDLRILTIVKNESEVVITQRIMFTYLFDIKKTLTITYEQYKNLQILPQNEFDLIIFDMHDENYFEENLLEEFVYENQEKCIPALKLYGLICFEGFKQNRVHRVYSLLSEYYLYQDFCDQYLFFPNITNNKSRFMTIFRKKQNNIPWDIQNNLELVHEKTKDSVLVLITSAIQSNNNNTIFLEKTRFRQLIHSVRSVRRNIPNAYIIISEINDLNESYCNILTYEGVREIHYYRQLNNYPKSFSEGVVLFNVLRTFCGTENEEENKKEFEYRSFIKLSGRYIILDNQPLFNYDEPVCKHLHNKEVMTRFFNIPKKYIRRFQEVLKKNLDSQDFRDSKIDIEHGIGQYFHELDDINCNYLGVAGFYATNAQMVIE